MTTVKTQYVPGVCNIGKPEIRKRRNTGLVGVAITIVLLVLFLMVPIPAPWRLLLFIPAGMAAAGLLQAGMHFCAGFALRGVFNLGDELDKTDTVEQAEYRKKDQQKAILIFGLSALIGAVVAVIALLLP